MDEPADVTLLRHAVTAAEKRIDTLEQALRQLLTALADVSFGNADGRAAYNAARQLLER